MLRASDLYGAIGLPKTQETTNPADETPTVRAQAQAAAKGKSLSGSYGTIAMVVLLGVLVSVKFYRES